MKSKAWIDENSSWLAVIISAVAGTAFLAIGAPPLYNEWQESNKKKDSPAAYAVPTVCTQNKWVLWGAVVVGALFWLLAIYMSFMKTSQGKR